MNGAYLGYIHYMHSNHEYFWRVYELNEYLAKICMHSLLRPLTKEDPMNATFRRIGKFSSG